MTHRKINLGQIKFIRGDWKVFSGNEVGALLGWWAWFRWRYLHSDSSPQDVFMIASTVSSKILKTIANHEGFNFIVSLFPISISR